MRGTFAFRTVLVVCGFAPVGLIACDETLDATKLAADAGTDAAANPDATTPTNDGGGGGDGGFAQDTCAGKLGTSTCNPVSGSGCDLANNGTCDYAPANGNFKCYGGPISNHGDVCAACDYGQNKGCSPGFTCSPDHICVRYCCVDTDCKGHGKCGVPGPFDLRNVGVCVDEMNEVCSASDGGSDAGTDAPIDSPIDSPADAPDDSPADAPDDGG